MHIKKTTILIVVAAAVAMSLPFYSYEWNLFMHIFGAIVFMGNIIVTAVWMSLARRSGDAAVLRFAIHGVIATDAFLTTPGSVVLLLNGGILATGWLKSGQASWIWVALALFALSGVAWLAFLVPIQRRMARVADASSGAGAPLPPEFHGLLKQWYRWGGIATFLPLATLVIMVLKPRFW